MKKVCRIALFFLLLCIIALTCVSAEFLPIEIRFDGDPASVVPTIVYDSATAGSCSGEVVDGRLKISTAVGNADTVTLTLPASANFYLYDYPYMRIKFKSSYLQNHFQTYIIASSNAVIEPTFMYYTNIGHSENTRDKWQSLVRHVGEDDHSVGFGPLSSAYTNPTIDDKKMVSAFRIDPIRITSGKAITELEYIAFFHTVEEANAYGNSFNVVENALDNTIFAYSKSKTTTKAELIVAIEAQVSSLISSLGLSYNVTPTVTVSDAQYMPGADDATGSFAFDIKLSTYKSVDFKKTYSGGSLVPATASGTVDVSSSLGLVEPGTEYTLTATVKNFVGVNSYKWYINSQNTSEGGTLLGTTTIASYKTAAPQALASYYYYVIASNGTTTITSPPIEVKVSGAIPFIFDFTDPAEVAKWGLNANLEKDPATDKMPILTDPDGTKFMRARTIVDKYPNYVRTFATPITLESHPYMVIKYRKNFAEDLNLYLQTTFYDVNVDLQYKWYEGPLLPMSQFKSDNKWDVKVIEMNDYLKSFSSTQKGPSAKGYVWKGNLYNMMIQPTTFVADYITDYEFMAFAPSLSDANEILADRAYSMIKSSTLTMSQNDIDQSATAPDKLSVAINGIAAKYGVSASDVAIFNVVNATITNAGKFDYSLKLTRDSDIFTYNTGLSGVITPSSVTVTALNDSATIGSNASLTATSEDLKTITSYAWFTNTSPSSVGATAAGTTATITPEILNVGANYFFVTVNGSTADGTVLTLTSDYYQINGIAPTDPIIWRFNNQGMVDLWQGRKFSTKIPVLLNGVMHTEFDTGTVVDDHYYRTDFSTKIPENYQFYLQAYPYFKIKYKITGAVGNFQIYFWNSLSTGSPYYGTNVSTETRDVWHTKSVDFTTTGLSSLDPYEGKLERFGAWIWNNNAAGTSDIEYIAFFPNSEEGKAAWQAFDSASPATQNSSDAYLPANIAVKQVLKDVKSDFSPISTIITNMAEAKNELDVVLKNRVKPGMTYTVSEGVDVKAGYAFDVNVKFGNVEAFADVTEKIVVKIRYPSPVIWDFSSKEFFSKWTVPGNCDIKYTDDGTNTFLTATMTEAADNCNITYENIAEENRFELSEYPYVALRYRSSHAGHMQLYPAVEGGANTEASGNFYKDISHTQGSDWTTKIFNASTSTGVGTWQGLLKYIRLDFMRPLLQIKHIDLDWIAFFPTEQSAQAYVNAPYLDGDMSLLDTFIKTFDTTPFESIYEDVNTEGTALAKINSLVASIQLPQNTRVFAEMISFNAGDPTVSDGMVGKYNFKLHFINGPLGSSVEKAIDLSMPLFPKVVFEILGTQIRTPGQNQGLRFGTKLSKVLLTDVDVTNIVYGTVLLPADLIPSGEALTLNTIPTNIGLKPNSAVADVVGKQIFSQTKDDLIYTAVIAGIDPADAFGMARRFSARAYVKFTFGGKDYIVYSDTIKTRSINEVQGLMQDGYEEEVDLKGAALYDNKLFMKPFWDGSTVYHETFWPVMPQGASNSDELIIEMMYPISDILIVKNAIHTSDFTEGVDYFLRDGKLVIPATSKIKRTPFTEYISDTQDNLHQFKSEVGPYKGKYIYWTEDAIIQSTYQYSISYRHATPWSSTAPNPDTDYDTGAFPITRAKLQNKENVKIAFFGDSITAGGNNTGNFGVTPLVPKWSVMIRERLNAIYGYNGVSIVNRAQGGQNTVWGVNGPNNSAPNAYAKTIFATDNPDLFVLAFGMNDEYTGVADFKANTINIINQILEIRPNCEFLLVSSSMPNPYWTTTANRTQYETVLEEVVTEMKANGVSIDCAKLQEMHKYFLTLKEYRDMTGNNANHQNDFLARLYAQTVLAYITNLN